MLTISLESGYVKGCINMEDKFFDIDEMMIDYSEMTSFDFNSAGFLACVAEKSEYSNQPYTFKYGNYDVLDMLKGLFAKQSVQNC